MKQFTSNSPFEEGNWTGSIDCPLTWTALPKVGLTLDPISGFLVWSACSLSITQSLYVRGELGNRYYSATKTTSSITATTMTRRKNPESAEKEARLQEAIVEYKKRVKQQKSASKVSINRLAKDFKVPRQTLTDRLNGKQARNKAHEETMNLSIHEEKELVHWITTLTQHGYAPRYRTVRELAEIIRNRRVLGVNDDDVQLVTYDTFGKD